MKTYTVTEIEPEDWENLHHMTPKEAKKILESGMLDGYLGSYSYGSSDEYDFDKAKLYYAVDVAIDALNEVISK